MIVVYASTMIIVHALTMIVRQPCTVIIVHACTVIIIHTSAMIIVHSCTTITSHACTIIITCECTVFTIVACTMIGVPAWTMTIVRRKEKDEKEEEEECSAGFWRCLMCYCLIRKTSHVRNVRLSPASGGLGGHRAHQYEKWCSRKLWNLDWISLSRFEERTWWTPSSAKTTVGRTVTVLGLRGVSGGAPCIIVVLEEMGK